MKNGPSSRSVTHLPPAHSSPSTHPFAHSAPGYSQSLPVYPPRTCPYPTSPSHARPRPSDLCVCVITGKKSESLLSRVRLVRRRM